MHLSSPDGSAKPGLLRQLYDRVLALAATPRALPWMAAVSFAESSFFPIPPDVLLAPMVVARPERAYLYAAVCTAASVLGGVLGYAIGFYLEDLGRWLMALMGHGEGLAEFQHWYARFGLWVILIKGLTPIPYKLVTIASGLAQFNFAAFLIASVLTRGARFWLTAWLLKRFGPAVQAQVEKRLGLAFTLGVLLLVGAVLLVKLL